MIDYLTGAIPWIRRRAETLLKYLQELNIPPSLELQLEAKKSRLSQTITEISILENDPGVRLPQYTPQMLVFFRNWVRVVDDIESIILPLVERWGSDEERMQQLVMRICQENNLPSIVTPVVALYSPDYFFVLEGPDVIYLPRLEGHFILHLPDLYHEIGHILLEHFQAELWGDLPDLLQNHFDQMHVRGLLQKDPLAIDGTYLALADSWKNRWLIEFTSDLFATYSCGPGYGWSHYHLCAAKSATIYHPSAGEDNLHPADEARWQAISIAMTDLGFESNARQIEKHWRNLVHLLGEKEPVNFHVAYPQLLLKEMYHQIEHGLSSLGIKPCSSITDFSENKSDLCVTDIINRAWTIFWQNPKGFSRWESDALALLNNH